jgi:hypothetical protein
VLAGVQALAGRFHADQAHRFFMRDVGIEDAHRIAAAAHAGDHRIGLAARHHLGHLHQAFLADHALEVAHHHRIRVRAGHRADDVERVVDVGHPVAHGFVQRVLQRLAARFDRHHGGAQQLHAVDVGRLALDVLAAHVHHAFQP